MRLAIAGILSQIRPRRWVRFVRMMNVVGSTRSPLFIPEFISAANAIDIAFSFGRHVSTLAHAESAVQGGSRLAARQPPRYARTKSRCRLRDINRSRPTCTFVGYTFRPRSNGFAAPGGATHPRCGKTVTPRPE